MRYYLSIDVSKKTLNVAWIVNDKRNHMNVSNDETDFKEIISQNPKILNHLRKEVKNFKEIDGSDLN